MSLHKPADLTHIECSLLQCLSRSFDDSIKIVKKRLDVVKKVVLIIELFNSLSSNKAN